MRFKDINQFTSDGSYRIDVSWDYLETWLEQHREIGLELNPDFQRAHVWTDDQYRAFVEFVLRGGIGSKELRFNSPGWMRGHSGTLVLVDGKQRLEAVRKFMRDELPIFGGHLFSDFKDRMRMLVASFSVRINDLPTMAMVLQWYLDINGGGIAHTDEELDKVRELLAAESKG